MAVTRLLHRTHQAATKASRRAPWSIHAAMARKTSEPRWLLDATLAAAALAGYRMCNQKRKK